MTRPATRLLIELAPITAPVAADAPRHEIVAALVLATHLAPRTIERALLAAPELEVSVRRRIDGQSDVALTVNPTSPRETPAHEPEPVPAEVPAAQGALDTAAAAAAAAAGAVLTRSAKRLRRTAHPAVCCSCSAELEPGEGFWPVAVNWPDREKAPVLCVQCLGRRPMQQDPIPAVVASATEQTRDSRMIEPVSAPVVLVPCLGCRRLAPKHRSGRCTACRSAAGRARERDPKRRAIKAARYDLDYRRERERVALVVAELGFVCARGGESWPPGSAFDLDHIDGALRPSCPPHNRGARSNPRRPP